MRFMTKAPLAVALGMVIAVAAMGQTGSGTTGSPPPAQPSPAAQGQAQGQANTTMQTPDASANASAETKTTVDASAESQKALDAIKEKGAKASAESRTKAEAKLQASAAKVDDAATKSGESKIAARLGGEFGMTAAQIQQERNEAGASWGNLMIAHTLQSNAKTDVTAMQLLQLHKEGTGWGSIASGLGLHLGEAISAMQSETKVASGLSAADGKVAVIHGAGARAGLTGSMSTVHANAETDAKVGIGAVKIKH